jgi:hypothetical protein
MNPHLRLPLCRSFLYRNKKRPPLSIDGRFFYFILYISHQNTASPKQTRFMPFKSRSGKQISPDINYLDLTPYPLITHQIEENALVTLLIPRYTSKFWARFYKPPANRQYMRLNLDHFGSAAWGLIDRHRKVGEICSELLLQFGDQIQPVEQRVTKFLSQLYVNKYITFREFNPDKPDAVNS